MENSVSEFPSDRVSSLRIMVVGDVMLDEYVQGSVERISPEAPVPVMKRSREWASPGGAAHVAACLAGLGCQVVLGGIVGDDREALKLREVLTERGVSDILFMTDPAAPTTVKTRFLAGNRQQLFRVDRESSANAATPIESLAERMCGEIASCAAVVLADYEKGALPPAVLSRLIGEARRQGKPVIVDPKKADFQAYRGASVLTPNVLEAERALGRLLPTDDAIEQAAAEVRRACTLETMLVTRGPLGMTGVDAAGVFHVQARVREVADVTGAGDTVVAVLAVALALGINIRVASEWASVAAGIAVSHPGTYIVSGEELRGALTGHPRKIGSWNTARAAIERERSRGRRIVFTNGCFDVLHAGHLHSLREARSFGDVLVVGLNSDISVRGLKGPSRPIIPQDQRALLLAGLECVDLVVVFDDLTPEAVIRHLAPDVLAKGADHDPATIVGGDFVRSRGGVVRSLSRIEGLSTTSIVERMQGDAARE